MGGSCTTDVGSNRFCRMRWHTSPVKDAAFVFALYSNACFGFGIAVAFVN